MGWVVVADAAPLPPPPGLRLSPLPYLPAWGFSCSLTLHPPTPGPCPPPCLPRAAPPDQRTTPCPLARQWAGGCVVVQFVCWSSMTVGAGAAAAAAARRLLVWGAVAGLVLLPPAGGRPPNVPLVTLELEHRPHHVSVGRWGGNASEVQTRVREAHGRRQVCRPGGPASGAGAAAGRACGLMRALWRARAEQGGRATGGLAALSSLTTFPAPPLPLPPQAWEAWRRGPGRSLSTSNLANM